MEKPTMAKQGSSLELEDDWQSSMSVPACLWVMYEQQVKCDVMFKIGKDLERIGAHSAILMSRSTVFFHEFTSGVVNKDTSILIPEVQPEEFTCFLRYVYTGDTDISGICLKKLLFLAEKYKVKELIKLLLEEQLENMNLNEFCPFVRRNEHHMTDLFTYKCLEYVFKQPLEVFRSSTFENLPYSFLKLLISHERLVIEENILCDSVLQWATKECELMNLEVNGENQRQMLQDALYFIRLPLLGQDYFLEKISENGLLTEHEEVPLLKYFLCPDKGLHNSPFSAHKRVAPETPYMFDPKHGETLSASTLHSVGSMPILSPDARHKPRSIYRFPDKGTGWVCVRNKTEAISFTPSRDINLTHVYIYGHCFNDGKLDVAMTVRDSESEIASTELTLDCLFEKESGMYEIGVENEVGSYGIRICAGQEYHILLTLNGFLTFHGIEGKISCTTDDGIVIEFKDSSYSDTDTGVEKGQIAGLKFNTR